MKNNITAMQELLYKYKNLPAPSGVWTKLLINAFIKDIEPLIEKEKQQIIHAYQKGCAETYGNDEPNPSDPEDIKAAEDYYTQTYMPK